MMIDVLPTEMDLERRSWMLLPRISLVREITPVFIERDQQVWS